MINLNAQDQNMLSGKMGETARLAMTVITRMADILEVDELMDITQAHIDACGLKSVSGLEFIELLARSGGKVAVPTTLNIIPMDLDNWQEQGIDQEYADFVRRMADAYLSLGCIPTWTCAPYQGYLTPHFGQQIVWGESNAIAYANSALGARTERYADFMDICGAITGRVPKYGLHLKENRRGHTLFRVAEFSKKDTKDSSYFATLGYLVGGMVKDKVPVVDGISGSVPNHCLKAFGAAAASSGGVGLFHIVGVTPEAPTLEAAFQDQAPAAVIDVTAEMLIRIRDEMSAEISDEKKLDAVVLGCPHFSYDEFAELADAINEVTGSCHPDVHFIVMSNHASLTLIKRTEIYDVVKKFGVQILLDSCVFHTPILAKSVKTIMTNSGKHTYYAPGELNAQVFFSDLKSCVRAAAKGSVDRKDLAWIRK